MNDIHRDLYIRWCQTTRIVLLISSPDEAVVTRYVVPEELLTRRSRFFRECLSRNDGTSTAHCELNDVTDNVAKAFFVWLHSPQPQVDEEATFDDVIDLGIFASRFRMAALSNQVTDRIRTRLASDEWQLKADIMDEIYRAAPSGSPLREVVRGALGKLPKSAMESGADREEWKATILKHAELGWDYIEASGSPWSAEIYLSGVCKFHDHEDVLEQKSEESLCDGCPFAGEDCYPVSTKLFQEPLPSTKSPLMSNIQSGAVQSVNGNLKDAFVDEHPSTTAMGHRVGNGIMISDDDDFSEYKDNGVDPDHRHTITNGHRPHGRAHDAADIIEEAVEESNETVTSEDLADDAAAIPVMQTIGTMTDMHNGDIAAGERAEDEAAKGLNKLRSKKKKKRGTSFSVGTN